MGIKSAAIATARQYRNKARNLWINKVESRKYPRVLGNILTLQETNELISTRLKAQEPFFAGRLGYNEARCMGETLFANGHYSEDTRIKMPLEAGFFPSNPEYFKKFTEFSTEALGVSDLIGVWYTPYQYRLLDSFAKEAQFTDLAYLEPFFIEHPWTQVLAGKRVLVVNPFTQSIQSNYHDRANRPFLDNLLPDFDLLTIKPPVTLAGNQPEGRTWIQEFEMLQEQVNTLEFDVAILGCGSYGFPLAGQIKKSGRSVIHLGGATQLLFGVKGRRWAERPEFSQVFEGSWTSPLESERPANFQSVEGGCYW